MAKRSILSMFKKTNVQDTICRPGKPTDTLSKSRTADPTFNRLGEPVQDTICRPGKPTDTLSKSRTAGPRRGTGANTSANLLWWPAAAQRTSIFVRGVPTMAEFMQYNTMMLGYSILINKCWENLIKLDLITE